MKVALIGLAGTRWLGNRLLHAIMEKEGFETHTVFFREDYQGGAPVQDREYDYVMQLLHEIQPDLIGFSVLSLFVKQARELTRRIKKDFDVPIAWGGIHPSLDAERCLEHADMVCIGEGEAPLREIASSIQSGDTRTDIQNVWFKKNGTVIRNSNRPLLQDMDSLPFPDISDTNKYYVVANALYREHNPSPYNKYEYDILTGRGCPFKCTYCGSHKTNTLGSGRVMRRRSVDNVMEELRQARTNFPKISRVRFWDDILTYDKKWLGQFAEAYAKEFRIPFFCYVHPKLIDEERVAMLRAMGVQEVALGFQHGSVRIRKEYFDRQESDEAILAATSLLQKNKVRMFLDMISTPFDTEDDNRENMELLLKVKKPFHLAMHTLTFFPGYKITERALEEKVITRNQIVGEEFQAQIAASQKEVTKSAWLCYQSLMGKAYIPNRLIEFMIKAKWHDRYLWVLRFLASMQMKWERICGSYEHNIALLKNGEFKHFASMVKYARLFFAQRT